MHELMGRVPTKNPSIIQNVYLCETVRCQKCHKTVPVGIEVVTFRKVGSSRKVLKHEYYCRPHAFDSHGVDYESKMRTWRA
jgi:hypothetical protein